MAPPPFRPNLRMDVHTCAAPTGPNRAVRGVYTPTATPASLHTTPSARSRAMSSAE